MYSIPDYALRFAAHCRSRLKYLETGAHDVTSAATAAHTARFWIRFAPHEARRNLTGTCTKQRARTGA